VLAAVKVSTHMKALTTFRRWREIDPFDLG